MMKDCLQGKALVVKKLGGHLSRSPRVQMEVSDQARGLRTCINGRDNTIKSYGFVV